MNAQQYEGKSDHDLLIHIATRVDEHINNIQLHGGNPGSHNSDFKKWLIIFILGMAAAGGGSTLANLGKFL